MKTDKVVQEFILTTIGLDINKESIDFIKSDMESIDFIKSDMESIDFIKSDMESIDFIKPHRDIKVNKEPNDKHKR